MNSTQLIDLTEDLESIPCSRNTKKRQLPPSIQVLSSCENRPKVNVAVGAYQANVSNRNFAITQGSAITTSKCAIKVQLSLVNASEFTATAHNGFVNDALIETLKRIPGARFDWNTQRFIFPVLSHDILVQRCSTHHGCIVDAIPREILTATQLKSNQESKKTLLVVEKQLIPNILMSQLASFQLEAIQFAYDKRGRVLIADEMGLGKTRTAIGVACLYSEDWPVLILCPSSAKYHWIMELRKLLCPHLIKSEEIFMCETAAEIDETNLKSMKFIILSYTIFTKVSSQIRNISINVVIVDESHYLKSRFAQRTTSLIPLLHKSRRVILLSGTPALSRPLELFTQLNALLPTEFSDFHIFGKRYCQSSNIGSAHSASKSLFTNQHVKFSHFGENCYKGANFTQELHVILTNSVMIRRLKKDVLHNLPPKRRYLLKVKVENLSKRLEFQKLLSRLTKYDELLERKQSFYRNEIEMAGQSLDSCHDSPTDSKNVLMKLYKDSGIEKLAGAIQHIRKYLQHNPAQKILLFAHHHEVLDQTVAFLRELKLPHIRIDGNTSSENRFLQCEEFQENINVRVAVLGITAAGIALTLTAASTLFFLELYWTPGVMLQAEDRVHRIGQLQDVKVFYIFAEDTIDELLWPLIRKKMKLLGEFVEGQQDQDLDTSIPTFESSGIGDVNFESLLKEGDFESAFGIDNDSLEANDEKITEYDEYEEYLKRKEPVDKLALKYIQSNEETIFRDQAHYTDVDIPSCTNVSRNSSFVVDLSSENTAVDENKSKCPRSIGTIDVSKKDRKLPYHMARVSTKDHHKTIFELD